MRGGKLFATGTPPQFDSYGNPLTKRPAFVLVPAGKEWKALLDESSPLPFQLRVDGPDRDGLFFRAVPDRDGWLVNVVNYNREPRRITLSGDGEFYDLMAERPLESTGELAPLAPMFFRFHSDSISE